MMGTSNWVIVCRWKDNHKQSSVHGTLYRWLWDSSPVLCVHTRVTTASVEYSITQHDHWWLVYDGEVAVNYSETLCLSRRNKTQKFITIYLSWSWGSCWPVPVSRIQKQRRIKLLGAPGQWKHFRPLFQTVFLSGGYYPPDSQTPRLPVPRQK